MSKLIEADYTQQFLLPPSLEDWVGPDHPARFVRDFVSQLDLDALGFKLQAQSADGRPAYANSLLLGVWLYGYMNKIRSTRKLEAACRNHMPLLWLTGMNHPDHNTLWRFWRDNKKALKKVFRHSVHVAQRMGLVGMLVHALDGTKIGVLSSPKGALHSGALEELLAAMEASIAAMEQAVESEGLPCEGAYGLPASLQDAQQRRDEIKAALEQLQTENAEHLMPAELDARMMTNHNGTQWAFNAQAVVDKLAGIIVAQDVSNEPTDYRQLQPMLEQVRENTGACAEATVADCGYRNTPQEVAANAQGHNTILPAHGRDSNPDNPYDKTHFHYDAEYDQYICPQGKTLPYSASNTKGGVIARIYQCRACHHCPVRGQCTRNKHGRTIRRDPNENFIKQKAVQRATPEAKALLCKRKGLIEPLFGHVKHNLGLRRWEMRGLANTQAQWAMNCLAINLGKIHKHINQVMGPRNPKNECPIIQKFTFRPHPNSWVV